MGNGLPFVPDPNHRVFSVNRHGLKMELTWSAPGSLLAPVHLLSSDEKITDLQFCDPGVGSLQVCLLEGLSF